MNTEKLCRYTRLSSVDDQDGGAGRIQDVGSGIQGSGSGGLPALEPAS